MVPPPPQQTAGPPQPPQSMMTYQQQPAFSAQPIGPPGVSFQPPPGPPPPAPQQFGTQVPMQMHTGGFIPNGAHQGQAPPHHTHHWLVGRRVSPH